MIEFWAVIGRTCFEAGFHTGLFSRTDPTATFLQLTALRDFLTSQNLRLSRWEVMNLNRIYSQRWDGTRKIFFRVLADDDTSAKLRLAASASGGSIPLPFPDKQELSAVTGLASFDTQFLTDFYNASDPDPNNISKLDQLLRQGIGGPKFFGLLDSELIILNKFIRAAEVRNLLTVFHNERWVQPITEAILGACDAGISERRYNFLAQQDLALFLRDNQDVADRLRKAGALV